MNIAIVCGHFVPDLGYIEVHLAEVLSGEHNVRVFTTASIPSYLKNITGKPGFQKGLTKNEKGYEIQRFAVKLSIGQMVIPSGLKKALKEYDPDKAVIIGVGKLFPNAAYNIDKNSIEKITLFGDNEDTYNKTRGLKRVFQSLVKNNLKSAAYSRAVEKSDRLVHYTPSTLSEVEKMIKPRLRKTLHEKSMEATLGFNPEVFFFDEDERNSLRNELGIEEREKLVLTLTRLTPSKKIENVIEAVGKAKEEHKDVKYLLVGSQEDKYSAYIKGKIKEKNLDRVITILPFAPHADIRKYFNAADLGIWTNTAITLFEALGTGLPLLLPRKGNLSHVLKKTKGSYFDEPGQLSEILIKQLEDWESTAERKKRSLELRNFFSWKTIADQIING